MNPFSRFILSAVLAVMLPVCTLAQSEQQLKRLSQGKETVSKDELVSFRSDIFVGDAITSLGELSKKLTGRGIVDSSPPSMRNKAIGVNIEAMFWKDALEMILRNNQLWYVDHPEYMEINTIENLARSQQQVQPQLAPGQGQQVSQTTTPAMGGMPTASAVVDSGPIYARTPEITISAIFIEINTTKVRESGMSLSLFRGRDLNLGVEILGAERVSNKVFGLTLDPVNPRLAVDISTAINFFESEQLGDVIARPQVTVRAGATGRVQIGQDFSVKQRDFAGNVIDQFFNTGTILIVKPRVFRVGETDFIDLSVSVERSNVQPGAVSTLINKTEATSQLSLLNGEESYVGGLYSNEETTVREGIPLLKDLPWWFFGLRYLFGFDSKIVTRKELIVVIKADFVPLVEDRLTQKRAADLQRERLNEMRRDMDQRSKKNK